MHIKLNITKKYLAFFKPMTSLCSSFSANVHLLLSIALLCLALTTKSEKHFAATYKTITRLKSTLMRFFCPLVRGHFWSINSTFALSR